MQKIVYQIFHRRLTLAPCVRKNCHTVQTIMWTMPRQKIFTYLKECGCCDICCLRYLKAKGDEYLDINETFKKFGVHMQNNLGGIQEKRPKTNHCTACLGFFSDKLQENILQNVVEHEAITKYDCDKVVIALSLPISINIRQISLWFALIKEFANEISDENPQDVPLKEAAKLIISKTICDTLKKTYDQNGVMINIFLNHKEETNELKKFLEADRQIFEENSKKKKIRKEITRNYLERNYIPAKISSESYESYLSVPPQIPNDSLYLENVTFTGPTVFVAGRYRKFSRKLSNSPWVLEGVRVMEDSIQEIIVRSVAPHFGVQENQITFSSSGREDVDVRCLGKGRPFVLEIPDSKRVQLPQHLASEIEVGIEKCRKISIQNLQIVKREELSELKQGEEKKKKLYRALCVMKKPATVDIMKKLNTSKPILIQQQTPLRVLHRRPLLNRPRTIYSVKGYVDKTNSKVLILDIVTQAGTYVKELIHGEFGRTSPSISSIIGQWIDIIALDVVGIDLDWPKDVNNRIFNDETLK